MAEVATAPAVLVDTSAWIEFDRATGSPTHTRLAVLVRQDLRLVATTEPVLMEVLAGPRREQDVDRWRRLLRSVSWVPLDPAADFDGAAMLYRRCRQQGVTPRGLTDCLIATVAVRSGLPLLTADADLARIAGVTPLTLA